MANRGMVIQTLLEAQLVNKRGHGRILRQVNRELAVRHKNQRVARHFERNRFTNPGSGDYGFERRSKRWQIIKERSGADPKRPNVFSGSMRRGILSSGQVTATQHRWRWRARNPDFPLPDWQREEIEAIAQPEIDEDTRLMERRYRMLAARPEFQRRRRRKVK